MVYMGVFARRLMLDTVLIEEVEVGELNELSREGLDVGVLTAR